MPNSSRSLTERPSVKEVSALGSSGKYCDVSCLEDTWGARHTTSLADLKKGFDQQQESWLEILSLAAAGILLTPSLPIMMAFMSSNFRSQERRERESEAGWGRGQLSTTDLYFTLAASPRQRK